MRARNLKPAFFKNEALADCSPLARLLFAGLWCLADREGRLEDRPKRIRAELMPYDDGSVDAMLQELHEAGFILRYEVNGGRFIQVVNFTKHQNPHCKEQASTIPAPDMHRTCPADSLLPLTDSLNPCSDTGAREQARSLPQGEGGKKKADTLTLVQFLDACKAGGEKTIPDNDPIFEYADTVGINQEMLTACWQEFKAAYLQTKKKQADWRAHFRNAVRRNWYKLWFLKEGEPAAWTTAGEQARRVAA